MQPLDKSMILTLDTWVARYMPVPKNIDCVEIEIINHDGVGVIFKGPGRINIKSQTEIEFTIHATPVDEDEALRLLKRAKEYPYDPLKQFTVDATDYKGVKWSCGWTSLDIKGDPKIGWPLTGKLDSLMTMTEGHWVASKSSVELVFHPKVSIPMDEQMVTTTKIDGTEVQRAWEYGQHILNILDTEIKFFYKPSAKSLWVTANTSKNLPHPHLENWIGEVFTILFGQIIYPRFVARNLGVLFVYLIRKIKIQE